MRKQKIQNKINMSRFFQNWIMFLLILPIVLKRTTNNSWFKTLFNTLKQNLKNVMDLF